jgi:hypothetical protein
MARKDQTPNDAASAFFSNESFSETVPPLKGVPSKRTRGQKNKATFTRQGPGESATLLSCGKSRNLNTDWKDSTRLLEATCLAKTLLYHRKLQLFLWKTRVSGIRATLMTDFNWGVFWAIVAAGIVLQLIWLCFVAIYNFAQRAYALHLLKQPAFPSASRSELLKTAREILGPDRSMEDVIAIADDLEKHKNR